MSRFPAIYAAFLITLLASAVTSATTRVTTRMPQGKTHEVNVKPFTTSVGKVPVCRDEWTMYKRSCFLFIMCHGTCSINEAKNSCMRKQSRLAKVPSPSHEEFFTRMLNTSEYIVLGGNDREDEGSWIWPDGSLIQDGYTNWASGEPNGETIANCMILAANSKKWYDIPCKHKITAVTMPSYVCERSPNLL